MSALSRLTATETKLFFREPMVVFFTLGFPPILLVILGAIPAFRRPDETLGGLRVIDLYAPIIVAMGVAMFALNSLSQLFASYREKGVLRRMRTTPVKPEVMLGAQLLMSTILSVLTMLVVLAIGRLAFDVPLPGDCRPTWRATCWRRWRCSRSVCSSPRSRRPARAPGRSGLCCSSRSCSSPASGYRATT